jgi:hypothetical protein
MVLDDRDAYYIWLEDLASVGATSGPRMFATSIFQGRVPKDCSPLEQYELRSAIDMNGLVQNYGRLNCN